MRTEQIVAFPYELERQFLRDTDWRFMGILGVTFLLLNSFMLYMQSLPVKNLSIEDIQRFTEVIYRVQIERPIMDNSGNKVIVSESADNVESIETVADQEREQLSAVDKIEARTAKRDAIRAKQEAKRKAIADRIKLVVTPTSRGNRLKTSSTSKGVIGLSDGDFRGSNIKEMIGIVGSDSRAADRIKSIREKGVLSDELGMIEFSDLSAISPGELRDMLNEAPVELNRSAITAKGRGVKSKNRSQNAIAAVVMLNKKQVQYCYWTFKRRDSNLKGRVVVEFTITPTGNVSRVRFRTSDWGGSLLKRDIEKCIRNVIMQWHFDPISDKDGDVSAGATFLFE